MVIDNSINCIIWKHKKAFKSLTYVKLDAKDAITVVNTATGKGLSWNWRCNSGMVR